MNSERPKFSSVFFLTFRVFCLLFLSSFFPFAHLHADETASKVSDISVEEISKSEGVQFYLQKEYDKALESFLALEKQYPKNVVTKRYLAAVYDMLQKREEAVQKLKEALTFQPDDAVSHQMLAEVYIKQRNLADAITEFQWILTRNPQGPLSEYAKNKIAAIQAIQNSMTTQNGKSMAVQDFMNSEASQAFAKGEYFKALEGFNKLVTDYPEDVLIRRFRGIALLRLGKKKEAIQTFKDALQLDSNNVALHFYLGQAYLENNQVEESRKSYQWVIANDEATYKIRAQQAIFQTLGKTQETRPWSMTFIQGYDFETNATYKTSDQDLRSPGDQNSGRYPTTFFGTYRLYQKNKWMITSDALYVQNLYNDFTRLNTYTAGGGISTLYIFKLLGKMSYMNLREGVTMTWLKNKAYLFSDSLSGTLITNLNNRNRLNLTYRWSHNQYNSTGTDPRFTSRNGSGHKASIAHTFYLNEAKTFYTQLGYEFEYQFTRGRDYRKYLHGGQASLHFPFIFKTEGDINFHFDDADYPLYASSEPPRRDDVSTLTVEWSRPLNSYLTLTAEYIWENSRSRNNNYEYIRNTIGAKMTVKY